MPSLAVINQKGGVGKTTTAVNLGAALAEAGRRVAIIDLDPQAHASLHLGVEPNSAAPSMYEVLMGAATLGSTWQIARERLWVARATIDLAAVEVELAGARERELRLAAAFRADNLDRRFDYVLIDCPPSLGVLTLNALSAVSHVLLPLQPHFLALDGLGKLLDTTAAVATRFNRSLQLAGVVLCLYESGTRLAGEVAGDVRRFFAQSRSSRVPWKDAQVFESVIRRNIRLAEAPSFGQSIFDYAPTSHGAADYKSLAAEIMRAFGAARAAA
jgi:chromosome partitioning protein